MKIHPTREWFESRAAAEEGREIGAGCPSVPCSLLTVVERPLLTSGQLSVRKGVPTILIDSEQEHSEKLVSLWHEVVHLLRAVGGYSQDEADVEAWAKRLAATCPDALAWVGIHEANA
jgi:hypothetical protein